MNLNRKNKITIAISVAIVVILASGTIVLSKYGNYKPRISAEPNINPQELTKAHAQEVMLPQIADVAVPKPKPQTPAPNVTDSGKVIVIILSQQKLYAYENGQLANSLAISSGTKSHPTPRGNFSVRSKVASMTMQGPDYYLPHVPNCMNFTDDDFIHGAYWHHNFGHPMSHGCINLSLGDAAWMYGWTPIGTKVIIQ